MKKNIALIAMAFAALSLAACDQPQEASTETTEITIGADGTQTESVMETTMEYHDDGSMTETIETETTVDPEGLMNAETIEESVEETTIDIE